MGFLLKLSVESARVIERRIASLDVDLYRNQMVG
jgi:hypothetical protein